MKNLQAFLSAQKPENIKIPLSERFKDEAGKVIEWELRALANEESDQILKDYKASGGVDVSGYKDLLTAASVVYPDLKDAELQDGLGTAPDPVATVKKLLTVGEWGSLVEAAMKQNDFDIDIKDLVKQAKN